MFSIKNIELFLEDGHGQILSKEDQAEILRRAQESESEGIISGGSIHSIFENSYIEELFKQEMERDPDQMALLIKFGGEKLNKEGSSNYPILTCSGLADQVLKSKVTKYVLQNDGTFKCDDCGAVILMVTAYHSVHEDHTELVGGGECHHVNHIYCPRCEKRPMPSDGPVIPMDNSGL